MALLARLLKYSYTGTTLSTSPQTNPLLSLGDTPRFGAGINASLLYREETLDANATVPTVVRDTQTNDGGGGTDPEVGDWLTIVDGAAGGSFAKITAVNYGTGDITLDRPLPALPSSGDTFRTFKRESLFQDVLLSELPGGFEDSRMITMNQSGTGGENNYRYWVQPVQPNGCDLKIMIGGDGQGLIVYPAIADARDDPYTRFDQVAGLDGVINPGWELGQAPETIYSEAQAVPYWGTGVVGSSQYLPIWVTRTVPENATAGEAVFILWLHIPDAVSQDASADPDPFNVAVIIHWNVPELTYTGSIAVDRTIYVNGGTRVTGTVVDQNNNPAVGLNCWLEIASGPGTLTVDTSTRTDENGQISSTYTAPTTLTTDVTFRIVIPTHPDF